MITIDDRGLAPMPVFLKITLASGTVTRRAIPETLWLKGARQTSITVPGRVSEVVIDPDQALPDLDRTNNTWNGRSR